MLLEQLGMILKDLVDPFSVFDSRHRYDAGIRYRQECFVLSDVSLGGYSNETSFEACQLNHVKDGTVLSQPSEEPCNFGVFI